MVGLGGHHYQSYVVFLYGNFQGSWWLFPAQVEIFRSKNERKLTQAAMATVLFDCVEELQYWLLLYVFIKVSDMFKEPGGVGQQQPLQPVDLVN